MTYWISFSGGIGSAASAAIAAINGYDFELVMADTGIEDEDLWRFSNDVAKLFKKELIVLRTGKTPWDVYVEKKYIGNTRTAHCSTVLKTEPVMRFLNKFANATDPLVLGMGHSEIDRLDRASLRWAPRPVVSLIVKHGWSTSDCKNYFHMMGIALPRLYDMGFPHNNCGGFCCKAGLKQFATLLEKMPDRFDTHAVEMNSAMDKIGPTARPFLRKTIDSKTEYLTLDSFREKYLAGDLDISPYDFGGCGCFSDD